jgi:hypothetical protein
VPIRVSSIILHRKLSLKESIQESFPIAITLLPNLVFGLVLADMLQKLFHVPAYIIGGLIIYTIGATLIPPLLIKIFKLYYKDANYYAIDNNYGFYDDQKNQNK